MRYRVRLSKEAEEARNRLSPHPKREVNAVLRRLEHGTDRRFDLPLEGQQNRWRARAGRDWRVIFEVTPEREIIILRISRRRGAYEGMEHPGPPEVREEAARYDAGAVDCVGCGEEVCDGS